MCARLQTGGWLLGSCRRRRRAWRGTRAHRERFAPPRGQLRERLPRGRRAQPARGRSARFPRGHVLPALAPDAAPEPPRRRRRPSDGAFAAETTGWRRADIGSGNGHGNARSLVRALVPIALGGTANGVTLLSPDTIDLIFQEQFKGTDLVLAMPVRWGSVSACRNRMRCQTFRMRRSAFGAVGAARWLS